MAAATKAMIGKSETSCTLYARLPRPMTVATPRMISQIGLVCLPAAGNAAVGRRKASMKAHASTTSAASISTSKNQKSGVIAPPLNTPLDYPVSAVYGPGWRPKGPSLPWGIGPFLGGSAGRSPRGWPWSGLGRPGAALIALPAVERALGMAAAPVERPLAALGQLVVLADGPRAGRRGVPVRAAGQRAHRGLVTPLGEPGGQLPQRFRGEHAGSCRGVHRLAGSKLLHLGPDINGAIHRSHPPGLP